MIPQKGSPDKNIRDFNPLFHIICEYLAWSDCTQSSTFLVRRLGRLCRRCAWADTIKYIANSRYFFPDVGNYVLIMIVNCPSSSERFAQFKMSGATYCNSRDRVQFGELDGEEPNTCCSKSQIWAPSWTVTDLQLPPQINSGVLSEASLSTPRHLDENIASHAVVQARGIVAASVCLTLDGTLKYSFSVAYVDLLYAPIPGVSPVEREY